eukprot:gene1182-1494_t
MKQMRSFYNRHFESKKGSSMYICGTPGTGKSLSVNAIFDEIPSKKCIKVYINCTVFKEPKEIYAQIYKSIKRVKNTSKKEPELIKEIESMLFDYDRDDDDSKMVLLVLDEVDLLINRNSEILYKIFGWPSQSESSRLILMCIANALDLVHRFIPRLGNTGREPEFLQFKPYTTEQIQFIIQQRISSCTDLELVDPEGIEMCARQVSTKNGDIRKAFDVFRVVINSKLLECKKNNIDSLPEEGYLITVDDILEALQMLFENKIVEIISNLPFHSKIVVLSAVLSNKKLTVESNNNSNKEMRLRIAWKDQKIVVPSGDVKDRVSRLLKDIAVRIQPFVPVDTTFIVSELKTADGFLISPHLTIEEALIENDLLVVVDFDSWKSEQQKLCKDLFCETSCVNYETDTPLTVGVGLHTQNKLYVTITQVKKLLRLELFDTSDLRGSIHKDGKHLMTHYEDDDQKNYAKVYFNVVNQIVESVECEVKTESANQPEIKIVAIQVKPGKQIAKGDIKHIQSAYDTLPVSGVTFPELVKTGPSYPDYDLDYYVSDGGNDKVAGPFANVVSGSGIRFEQTDIIRADSSYPQGDSFINSFYTDLQVVNTTEKKLTITKVSSEYQDKQGEWQPIQAFFGTKSGGNYNWSREGTLIQVDSRDTFPISVNSRITIKGKVLDRNKRSHGSLPNPLNIRITIVDDTQTTTLIPVVYKNITEYPLTVTLKYRIPRVSEKILYFQTVDDVETESRGFVQVSEKEERDGKYIVLSNSLSSSSYYVNNRELLLHGYTAHKKGESKHLIEKYGATSGNYTLKVYAMVDLSLRKTTGFCFELSTKQSTSVGYYVVPDLN